MVLDSLSHSNHAARVLPQSCPNGMASFKLVYLKPLKDVLALNTPETPPTSAGSAGTQLVKVFKAARMCLH